MRAGGVLVLVVTACGDNVIPATQIVGQVFADDNANGVRDEGEAPLAAVVYIELDNDPSIGWDEPRTRTAADGTFTLPVDGPGTYDVRMIPPFGRRAAVAMQRPMARVAGSAPIIGGSDASVDEFGFMVSLAAKFGTFVYPTCGGVLITDRHVVTAAHCSVGEMASEVAIIADTLDPFDDGALVLDVANIAIHPSFDNDVANGFDIAVWTLAEPIDLVANGLTTVEMLGESTSALAEAGTLATALGWGTSDRDSPLLQQVHMPIVSSDDCGAAYDEVATFETQLCAGTTEGGLDSCQGDSGGPLLVRDPVREVWMHAGVTSWGEGCALPGYPGIYARTSALSAWVMEAAKEPAVSMLVTIESGTYEATADFPAFSTMREQAGAIGARWQATGTTLPTAVSPDTPVSLSFAILSDDPTLTDFTCRFESDVLDPALGQDVACGLGTTEVSLAGFSTGIFVTELVVSRPGATTAFHRRTNIVSGTPASVVEQGALAATDRADPDYSFATYYIDYYEVTGLSGTCAFAVDVTSEAFYPFLVLYDLDKRSFTQGGGTLAIGENQGERTSRVIVLPEPGKRYLIGVSSFDADEVGDYEIELVNDGTLTPR